VSGTIAVFVERLAGFDPAEARALDTELAELGGGIEVYALVYPDYAAPVPNRPQENREDFFVWRSEAGVPLWAWFNAGVDQAGDVEVMRDLDHDLKPTGWVLDVEGEWVKSAKLGTLAQGCAALGRPRRASLAAASASHVNYDYRALELAGFEIDWQCYLDSGEGPHPQVAVAELYRSNFVLPGWEYRHRLGDVYGWGKVGEVTKGRATFDSFKRPGSSDATFAVADREWGWTVMDGKLSRNGSEVGLLMGRCEYRRIRVTFDLTRGAAEKRSLHEWTELAASARAPGAKVRPASVYCGSEAVRTDVIAAIARGAG
jgi:hypothetical protein